ncbi:MAG: chorismate mutase [Hyphomicrobiales bacterium]
MTDTARPQTMSGIRAEIDRIDEQLVELLAARQRLVEQAITVKKRDGIPARVPQRIEQVMAHVRRLAGTHRVDPALAETIWTEMLEWFIAHEERELGRKR